MADDPLHSSRRIDRRTALKTAGATGIAGLAGCAGGGGQSDGTTSDGTTTTAGDGSKPELTMWLGYITESPAKKKYTQEVARRAEEKFDVSINIKGVAYSNFVREFRAAAAAGDYPHLVDMQTNPEVLAGGVGRPIDDLFEGSKTQKKATERVVEPMRMWGNQLTGESQIAAWPVGFRPHLPVWRMDWLKQAGIPRERVNFSNGSNSYEELVDVYKQLQQTQLGQQSGHAPSITAMKASDCEYLEMYIPQFGGPISGVVNREGTEATIDSQAARDAIQMQFDYLDKGYYHNSSVTAGDEKATTLHWAGKIASNPLQDTSDMWASYRNEQSQAMQNMEYAFSVPHNGGTKATLSWYLSLGFVEPAFQSQAELDAAAQFLDWWATSEEAAPGIPKQLGFLPINPGIIETNDWFGQSKLHENFWRGAALKTFEEFKQATVPAVPGGTKITYEIPAKMYDQIRQGTSIEEATSRAAEEINSVLAKHGRR